MKLETISVDGLEVFANPCDLRRDLHTFVEYVRHREVKRSHRGNNLSKADAKRLARLMTDPEALREVEDRGESHWIDFIDSFAWKLGFVRYDIEGTYIGYSSSEPSFPDNYIEFQGGKYDRFMASSLQHQERLLFKTLVEKQGDSESEFFHAGVMGRLDSFSIRGCATGVVPTLNFAAIRQFLLKNLMECRSGVWHSVSSLVRYLKAQHPYFLIPQEPRFKYQCDREAGRYGNFHESTSKWGNELVISERDPDAFERVEGRYVERFLEGLPLTLGYLEVAYGPPREKNRFPSRDRLRAFRVNERFLRAMTGELSAPRVAVLPNFELHVESEFYPAQVMAKLAPLTDLVSSDTVSILKLRKKHVVACMAEDETLDVAALLRDLSGRDLPQNVSAELRQWGRHSEKFILYEGFGLLEGDAELRVAEQHTVERITPTLRIVRSPETLFDRLQKAELAPLLVKHRKGSLKPLPDGVRTLFARSSQVAAKPKKKETVTVGRETTVTLHFSTKALFEQFLRAMALSGCPMEVDRSSRSLSFAAQREAEAESAFKALRKEYVVRIEDL